VDERMALVWELTRQQWALAGREMADATNRLGVNMTCQFRDAGNVVRDQLRGEKASRMTSRHIAGEFREFRENFNELLDRAATRV
jgi:hypothetical protein